MGTWLAPPGFEMAVDFLGVRGKDGATRRKGWRMAAPYLYPGVYVEEVPSGVRPIAGTSTSDTAFVDWFARGPLDRAVRITSLTDFDREFGGLHQSSEASYGIQQYYLNGGRTGWVVRIVAPDASAASVVLSGGSPPAEVLTVTAASPGQWGNNVQVAVNHEGVSAPAFNLLVREVVSTGPKSVARASETYHNVSADAASSRFVGAVVNRDSSLVHVHYTGTGAPPAETGDAASGPWVALGSTDQTMGKDGTLPGSDDWNTSAGAAALLGAPHDGNPAVNRGIHELERISPFIFNLLCLPGTADLDPSSMTTVLAAAASLCEDRRAFLLVDIPASVDTVEDMVAWTNGSAKPQTANAAVYFPRLQVPDRLRGNELRSVGASGTLAGVYARTDADRGVWKAPAGTEAGLRNATLRLTLIDLENGALNPLGVNTLRSFPVYGNVAWGSRTLEGSDQQASEWKYVPVRRTALFIEESLYQGLKWVVFEPNDEPLWSQIRLNVGSFMHGLFRQGAFAGTTPREAYLVKCDSETTTPADVNLGIVNVIVGFAPLRPAEFVIIKLQQLAGQVQV